MTRAVQQGVIPSPADPSNGSGIQAPVMHDPGPGTGTPQSGSVGPNIVSDPGQAIGPNIVHDPGPPSSGVQSPGLPLNNQSNGPLSRGTPPSAPGDGGTPAGGGSAPTAVRSDQAFAPLPGGGGGGGGVLMSAFDDGGDVDGGGGPPSLDDAMSTIQDTLNYGRQKNGMGDQGGQDDNAPGGFAANWQKMRPSTNVEDDRDLSDVEGSEGPQPKMGPASSPLGPMPKQVARPWPYNGASGVLHDTASYDDGGDVDNPSNAGMPQQPQGNRPQGAPPSIVGYAMGSDAVLPDVAQALEGKVDPHGQMDGSTRKMLAIASAPDQQTQWGMMQHYRQKFNATSAFARAAAQGTPQKPADIGAAAKAATQAYENVPDGTQLSFKPTNGGVIAHVHHLVSKGGNQAQQGFDDGGDVQSGLPDVLGTGAPSIPSSDYPTPDVDPDAATDKMITGRAGDNRKGIDLQDNDVSVPLTVQQFQQFLAKDGQYDNIMDKGAAQSLTDYVKGFGGQRGDAFAQAPQGAPQDLTQPQDISVLPRNPTPQQIQAFNQSNGGVNRKAFQQDIPDDEKDTVEQANRLFPSVSQTAERQKWIADQLGAKAERANKLDVANATWGHRENIAKTGADRAIEVQRMRSATARENNQNTNATRLGMSQIAAQQRALTGQQAQLVSMVRSQIAANPSADPQAMLRTIAPLAARFGIDPRRVVSLAIAGAPAGGAATAGQEPLGNNQPQPQQTDIAYLRAHPEVAAKFDARFGAGASQRALGQ